ncbi:polysaccharide deacetylase family protein [Caulobacter endophyticus]|uniref:Chitooligosaccharide deacetylase n=1 Tax=Caulobacter endophyticus TaxID=2172652 RepID=A0A2T9K1P4_9CAUL|nr:polysaccharide deacetylase family protein [Caulobacter endophyticus]PVM89793.1 polysaccharide deacetylase [Caulobacter endophyticus]
MRSVALLVLALLAPATALAQSFDVAVTVDDLPVHGALPPGMTRLSITKAHIADFKAHGVRQAYGFVNSAKATDAESNAVLDAWRTAGHPLANHTATHLNLEKAETLDAWIADLEAGEPAVAERMKGQEWRYLRFPNLTAGTRPERHEGAAAYLAAHGYKVAHVTLSFSDWSYSDAYARCVASNDQAAIRTMEDQYLRGVDDELTRMRAVSQKVYGRMIPQVLLTHIGGWSAHMLPQVLDRLDAAGARYVTLQEAQKDPAYAQAEALPGGGGIMERTAKARKIDLSNIVSPSEQVDPKALCR